MSQMPKISLIMSVYNGEDYLEEAIESVLNQTFRDFELIVINDCSTDSTSQILERFAQQDCRVKVHTNAVNLRLPSSLNKAITWRKASILPEWTQTIFVFRTDWKSSLRLWKRTPRWRCPPAGI